MGGQARVFRCASCGESLTEVGTTRTYNSSGVQETVILGVCSVCMGKKNEEIRDLGRQLSQMEDVVEAQHGVLKQAGLVLPDFPCDTCEVAGSCLAHCEKRLQWDQQISDTQAKMALS